jgi:uncharacterized protein YegL
MAGEPLDAVETGVYKTLSSLKKDPHALETVYVSVIAFGAKAKVLTPLTEVVSIAPPPFSLRPGTSLGAALDLLRESIIKEVKKTTAEAKGDYRPLVFILTDGQPTDDWESALARLRSVKPSLASVYGFGCGDEVDFETLAKISDVCFQVDSLTTESLTRLFVWLTASIQKSVASPEGPISLDKTPPLDKGMKLIDKERPPKPQQDQARLYLHSICLKTRKHYLIRYRFSPAHSIFICDKTVPLPEDFFADGSMKAPPVDAKLIHYHAECPHCHNEGWGTCGFCGHLFCLNPENPPNKITCPFCETQLTMNLNEDDSFSVDGSVG